MEIIVWHINLLELLEVDHFVLGALPKQVGGAAGIAGLHHEHGEGRALLLGVSGVAAIVLGLNQIGIVVSYYVVILVVVRKLVTHHCVDLGHLVLLEVLLCWHRLA